MLSLRKKTYVYFIKMFKVYCVVFYNIRVFMLLIIIENKYFH